MVAVADMIGTTLLTLACHPHWAPAQKVWSDNTIKNKKIQD